MQSCFPEGGEYPKDTCVPFVRLAIARWKSSQPSPTPRVDSINPYLAQIAKLQEDIAALEEKNTRLVDYYCGRVADVTQPVADENNKLHIENSKLRRELEALKRKK